MIGNIYADVGDLSIVSDNPFPTYHWVNITGFTKCGKTKFIYDLAQELRIAHFDLEHGTDAYVGQFIKCNNFKEFRQKSAWLQQNLATIRPDVIVTDPLDVLADMIAKDYMKEKGIDSLSEMPYGQGWSDCRDILSNAIRFLQSLAPLVITITHLKVNIGGESRGNITYLDMDLPGQTKAWVQNTCDVHAVFVRAKNDEGGTYLKVMFENTATTEISFGGGRIPEFYDATTAELFKEQILNKFPNRGL